MRGRCLGAVGSPSLSGFEKCEVTKGNDVVVPCLTPAMWRELLTKKIAKTMKNMHIDNISTFSFRFWCVRVSSVLFN